MHGHMVPEHISTPLENSKLEYSYSFACSRAAREPVRIQAPSIEIATQCCSSAPAVLRYY